MATAELYHNGPGFGKEIETMGHSLVFHFSFSPLTRA